MNPNLTILYEDNHLIAVNKPSGVLVQGDESGEPCLMDDVKKYIKDKYQKPGNVFLGLIHRLDRNVSGIILFAKTSKGASRLSEQFRDHSVEKIYHAWVEGKPKQDKAVLKNYLRKDEKLNKSKVFDKETPGADYAELAYEVVRTEENVKLETMEGPFSGGTASLLKVVLKTGRSHQIRAQLARLGHPIVGDLKYGAAFAMPDQSLKLSATKLSFKAATSEERKVIEIHVPELL